MHPCFAGCLAHPAAGFGSPRYAGFNYGGCACRLCGGMCVYILFRKFLSLFRHSLRIGYCQEVCCEVLQAVSVGTVKNLSSQYIYTHATTQPACAPTIIKSCISGTAKACSRVRFKAEKWHVCIIPSRN